MLLPFLQPNCYFLAFSGIPVFLNDLWLTNFLPKEPQCIFSDELCTIFENLLGNLILFLYLYISIFTFYFLFFLSLLYIFSIEFIILMYFLSHWMEFCTLFDYVLGKLHSIFHFYIFLHFLFFLYIYLLFFFQSFFFILL